MKVESLLEGEERLSFEYPIYYDFLYIGKNKDGLHIFKSDIAGNAEGVCMHYGFDTIYKCNILERLKNQARGK